MMDELSIWSKQLTTNDIAAFIDMTMTGSESDLVAYPNFNDAPVCESNISNTILNDLSANDLNGGLMNFLLSTGCTSNWTIGSNKVQNCSSCLDLVEITLATGVLEGLYSARNQITVRQGAQFVQGKDISLSAPIVLFETENTVPATTILTINHDGCQD